MALQKSLSKDIVKQFKQMKYAISDKALSIQRAAVDVGVLPCYP